MNLVSKYETGVYYTIKSTSNNKTIPNLLCRKCDEEQFFTIAKTLIIAYLLLLSVYVLFRLYYKMYVMRKKM